MTYKEKLSLANIGSSILVSVIYTMIMFSRYQGGLLDDSNIFKMWAWIFIIFIPITVVSKIVMLIVFHIVEAVSLTVKGEDMDDLDPVTDERDKLIELKSDRLSMYIFTAGFGFAMFTQLFDVSNHIFFIIVFGFGFFADVLSEGLKFLYYKRGF